MKEADKIFFKETASMKLHFSGFTVRKTPLRNKMQKDMFKIERWKLKMYKKLLIENGWGWIFVIKFREKNHVTYSMAT